MTDKKSVLVIGLQPTLIDFSDPDYAAYPGMDAAKVLAGLKAAEDNLTHLGYDVQMCLTDFGETAEAVVQDHLKQKRFDCILIGAGVRTIAGNFILFEKLIDRANSECKYQVPTAPRKCILTLGRSVASLILVVDYSRLSDEPRGLGAMGDGYSPSRRLEPIAVPPPPPRQYPHSPCGNQAAPRP